MAAVRESFGWFDRSATGRLAVTGPDRYSWLQGMVSNDVRLLETGAVQRLQACLLDPTGHTLSDLALIEVPAGSPLATDAARPPFVLVETPCGEAERVREQLDRFLILEDAEIHIISAETACLSVQGPDIGVQRTDRLQVVPADHTGSDGFDLIGPEADVAEMSGGLRDWGGPEIGPAAQEILRIEAGIPKYGVDMDASTLAPEAGLMATHVSLTKGCYVGQEIVARIDSRGHTNRALTGLIAHGETCAAPAEKLFADELDGAGRECGWITSVASVSPAAGGRAIALGYVRHEQRTAGAWLRLGAPDSSRRVEIADLPFYRGRAS
ncbi:MAG TPA: hypothetical protein VKT77_23430 [Chthonomonadaceae bacterium]|nr:hypothetical protein [Chthonomonadaceae bacterium]